MWRENRGPGDISDITLDDIASKANYYGLFAQASGNTVSGVTADGIFIFGSRTNVMAEATIGGSISGLSLDGVQIIKLE